VVAAGGTAGHVVPAMAVAAELRASGAEVSFLGTRERIEAELVPQGTLAERMRAAGAGIPAFYTPAAVGTELAEGRETRVFNGREYLLEEALPLDYAFIRAYQADAFGNLRFRRAQRNFNPLMAMAARVTIVEVEEDILPLGAIDPDDVHLSGIFVHRLVKVPPAPEGWWPMRATEIAARETAQKEAAR